MPDLLNKIGARWVHLRTCQVCGTTLCCDSSPNRHATGHARASGHPVIAFPTYRPGALSTTLEIRRELSRVYRDMRAGILNTSDGTRLAYVLAVMARLVEQTEDESRIEALEEIVRERHSDVFEAH